MSATRRRAARNRTRGASGLALETPGTQVGPGFPPVPQSSAGLAEERDAPGVLPPVVVAPSGVGAWLQDLARPTPSPAWNMTKLVVPVVVFAVVWWLTGGIGWAILAAIAAWFVAAWFAKKKANAAAPSATPAAV